MKKSMRQCRGIVLLALLVLGIWIELVYGEGSSEIVQKLGPDLFGKIAFSEDGRVYIGNSYGGELRVHGSDFSQSISAESLHNLKFSHANANQVIVTDPTFSGDEGQICQILRYDLIQQQGTLILLPTQDEYCRGRSLINDAGLVVSVVSNSDSIIFTHFDGTQSAFGLPAGYSFQGYGEGVLSPDGIFKSIVVSDHDARLVTVSIGAGVSLGQTFPEQFGESISIENGNLGGDIVFNTYKRAYLLKASGEVSTIKYKEASSITAIDLNDEGLVVGTMSIADEPHAFYKKGAKTVDLTCMFPKSGAYEPTAALATNNSGQVVVSARPRNKNHSRDQLLLLKPKALRAKANYCVHFNAKVVGSCDKYFQNNADVIRQTFTFPFDTQPSCGVEAVIKDSKGKPVKNGTVVLLAGYGSNREVKASARTDSRGRAKLYYPLNTVESYYWEIRFWQHPKFYSRGKTIQLKSLDGGGGSEV